MLESIPSWLSTGFISVVGFLFVLTVVVFFHELGHFLVARWCGVTVTTFSIGFGKELFAWVDRSGTRWRVAAIPLGGYVRFLDDANAASAPSEDNLEQLTEEEKKGAFQTKPLWQRAAVVSAGPLANFLLAIVIYSSVNAIVGVRQTSPVFDAVEKGSPAEKAGIRPGDRVVSIDGAEIESYNDLARVIFPSPGREFDIGIERDGKRLNFNVTAEQKEFDDDIGVTVKYGDIGARPAHPPRVGGIVKGQPADRAGMRSGDLVTRIGDTPIRTFDDIVQTVRNSPGREIEVEALRDGKKMIFQMTPVPVVVEQESGASVQHVRIGIAVALPEPRPVSLAKAIQLGVTETWLNISQTLTGLRDIVLQRQSADQMGGPIMMAEVTARFVDRGIEPLLRWTAFISTIIGLLNLLPIPILDGGHLLFYAIEAVRRRPLSQRMQEVSFQIGFVLVMSLIVYVNLNDLIRVGKRWLFGGG